MTRRATITAAIIALDEERNLAELLPLLEWTDEIVVVDGGSRDATAEVAEGHGCDVIRHRFDTFAAQRNRALNLARADWVLSIDADERPTPALVAEIQEQTARTRHDGFRVPIRSSIFGRRLRYCGTQDDSPVRLVRRKKGRWQGDVHEVMHVSGTVGRLENWLVHRSTPNLDVYLKKMRCYTLLEAQRRVAAGQSPTWYAPWLDPPREVLRRLVGKLGVLDGPAGWAFCLLSGLSQWVLARRHRELWQGLLRERNNAAPDDRRRAA